MKKSAVRVAFLLVALVCTALAQQAKKTGVLEGAELKSVVPSSYFFDGLVSPVQARNSGAVRFENGKLFLAALVDTSGYSADVQKKCQGLLITETKASINDADLAPGQYCFGFTADGKFVVLDVSSAEVLHADAKSDDTLKRPVPLKIAADGDSYKLYAGKQYVTVKAK
jgi:hypothetical protein